MVPRESKSNTYAKFWKTNKEYYGIFESGLLWITAQSLLLLLRKYVAF